MIEASINNLKNDHDVLIGARSFDEERLDLFVVCQILDWIDTDFKIRDR